MSLLVSCTRLFVLFFALIDNKSFDLGGGGVLLALAVGVDKY